MSLLDLVLTIIRPNWLTVLKQTGCEATSIGQVVDALLMS